MKYLKYLKSSILSISVMLVVALISLSKGSDTNWDLHMYHIYSGWMVSDFRFEKDVAAVDMQTFYPPYLNYLIYKLWSQNTIVYNIVLGLVQSLSVVIGLKIINTDQLISKNNLFLKLTYFSLSTLILVFSPLFLSEIGTSFQSSLTAPMVLAAYYFSLPLKSKNLFLAAFLISASFFLKYTNGVFLISWLLTIPFLFRDRISLKSILCGIVVALLIFSWWHLYLWIKYDNPVFPLANGIFRSELYPIKSFRDERFHFDGIRDFLKWIVEINNGSNKTLEFKYVSFVYTIFVATLIPFFCRFNPKSINSYLALNVVISLSLWAVIFSYSRYYIAGDLLIGIFVLRVILSNFNDAYAKVFILIILAIFGLIQSINSPDWSNKLMEDRIELKADDRVPMNVLEIGLQLSKILVQLNTDSRIVRVGGDLSALTSGGVNKFDKNLPVAIIFERRFINDAIPIATKIFPNLFVDYCNKYPGHKNLDDGSDFQLNSVALVCHLTNKQYKDEFLIDMRNSYGSNPNVLNLIGFSGSEPSGRWTVSDASTIEFAGCIRRGFHNVHIDYFAHPTDTFNVDLSSIQLGSLGNSTPNSTSFDRRVFIDETCNPQISFKSKYLPRSPYEMKTGDDKRNLGLRVIEVKIN